jgi:rsbT co-antagonist protein RsbR
MSGDTRRQDRPVDDVSATDAADFRLFFDLTIDLLCIAGLDGYFRKLNPSFERTLGWSDAELKAKPFLEFVHEEDRQSTIDAVSTLSDGREVIDFENRYRCKDGSYRWLQWRSRPEVSRGLILASAKDITLRREAEDRVRKLTADLERRVAEQSRAIQELSTPIIKLFDEVVLMPLVGVIDTARAQQLIESLLESIVANEARVAILDITGVPIVDTKVAQHLISAVHAARMLGAEVVVTGISPGTAQTITKLGIDVSPLRTCGTLRKGLSEALALVGRRLVQVEAAR